MAERALTAAQTPSPQWFARVHYTDPQPDEATVERYIAARRLWRRDRDWASLARDTCSLSVDWPAMFVKILERERHEVDGEEDPKDETADGVKPSAVVVSTPPPTSGDSGVLQLERHDDEGEVEPEGEATGIATASAADVSTPPRTSGGYGVDDGQLSPPALIDAKEQERKAKRVRHCVFNESQKNWIATKCRDSAHPERGLPTSLAPTASALSQILFDGVKEGVLREGTTLEDLRQVVRDSESTVTLVRIVVRQASASTISEDLSVVEEYNSHEVDVDVYTTIGDVICRLLAVLNVPDTRLDELAFRSVARVGRSVRVTPVSAEAWASAYREILVWRK